MGKDKSDSEVLTVPRTKTKVTEPKLYRVILINDDYTTMDFVISVLESIFGKSPAEATQIMLQVHHKGQGLCGVFSKQIAEAKIALVHQRARAAGFPLRCTMEED